MQNRAKKILNEYNVIQSAQLSIAPSEVSNSFLRRGQSVPTKRQLVTDPIALPENGVESANASVKRRAFAITSLQDSALARSPPRTCNYADFGCVPDHPVHDSKADVSPTKHVDAEPHDHCARDLSLSEVVRPDINVSFTTDASLGIHSTVSSPVSPSSSDSAEAFCIEPASSQTINTFLDVLPSAHRSTLTSALEVLSTLPAPGLGLFCPDSPETDVQSPSVMVPSAVNATLDCTHRSGSPWDVPLPSWQKLRPLPSPDFQGYIYVPFQKSGKPSLFRVGMASVSGVSGEIIITHQFPRSFVDAVLRQAYLPNNPGFYAIKSGRSFGIYRTLDEVADLLNCPDHDVKFGFRDTWAAVQLFMNRKGANGLDPASFLWHGLSPRNGITDT